ncbi:MarR family winged helix-turn-helix transcriptional regulator [Actinoplanes sp. NPDC049265]|uniref:MarR family winged helix-turn-helix transcriptional regulator n=1 Tax=Actinoplanes sp. NPDC049265 TaxID=3363902 RepID=UPI0037245A33
MDRTDLTAAVVAHHELFLMTGDRLTQVFAELSLTPATAHALWLLDPQAPPPAMKTMAERLYCNASNLTFVSNQLVDRGLARREVDPADRRSRVLVLTERGREVRDELIRETLARTPFATLGPDEVAQLRVLLERATGNAGSADGVTETPARAAGNAGIS